MSATESDLPDLSGDMSEADALQWMYHIIGDINKDFDGKVNALLEMGCNYLGTEAGFFTRIEDDNQHIVHAHGSKGLVEAGMSCPLDKAYCKRTIEHDGLLTVQHAGIQGWEGDSAYETFGLETYIGVRVDVEGELYGTFCFADRAPREEPFTDSEETVVELIGKWVSYELFQQKAMKELAKQRDRLDEYTRIISHDLRNPISIIKGYIDVAEETGNPDDFDRCRRAVDRMDSMIEKLLVLSREGEIISDHQEVRIKDVVKESWLLIQTNEARLKASVSQTVTGDRSRLQQLFENLLRNAVEHGGRDVRVVVGDLDDGNGFYVADNGPGIPDSEKDSMFTDDNAMLQEGDRLGLSIVNQIVMAHNWNIEVSDSESGGARINIRFGDDEPEADVKEMTP